MKFTLRQLEVFVAVARCGTVTRAAAGVALSQSATSAALGELEKQFSCQLFDRIGKALYLNELGQRLLPRAVEILDRGAEIESLLAGQQGWGRLRVGATLTIGNYLATLLVADFLQQHPESRVRLQVNNTQKIVEQLVQHELDLGLIEGSYQHPDLAGEVWLNDELTIFAAPDHPLTQRAMVSLSDLLQEAWILREPGSGTRETFDHAFHAVLPQLNIRLELEHTEAIKRAVENHLGISCISKLALREAFQRGSLAPIPTPWLNLRRDFHLIWHKQKYLTAGMNAFLELCRKQQTEDFSRLPIP